jgi:menaquinone-dependent protoporphyrinogen oxidase
VSDPRNAALVVYASTHGHTGRIARRIGEVLTSEGLDAHVFELPRSGPTPDLNDFDFVVAGGSVHRGRHQHHLVDWLVHHHVALGLRPSGFFSVSLTAADDTAEARAATRELIDELVENTGWTPDVTLAVAGALQYREYNLPTRVLMRLIARRHEGATDTSHDTDYTDWDAVEHFAVKVANRVARDARVPA